MKYCNDNITRDSLQYDYGMYLRYTYYNSLKLVIVKVVLYVTDAILGTYIHMHLWLTKQRLTSV